MTYTSTRRQRRLRRERQDRHEFYAMIARGALITAGLATMGLLFPVMIIEWLAGCGEVFYYGDGTWQTGQCVFMDSLHPVREGVWK